MYGGEAGAAEESKEKHESEEEVDDEEDELEEEEEAGATDAVGAGRDGGDEVARRDWSLDTENEEKVVGEAEKKENESSAVPTAGAFYIHDDRFGEAGRWQHRFFSRLIKPSFSTARFTIPMGSI